MTAFDPYALNLSGLTLDQRAAFEDLDPTDCAWIEMDLPPNWQSSTKSVSDRAVMSARAYVRNEGIKLPYEKKVIHAKKVIDQAFRRDVSWYLSYSGGKDSTILSHLMVEQLGSTVPHLFSNTRLEYTETSRQVKKWGKWLEERGVVLHTAFPKDRAGEVWRKAGVPLFSKAVGHKLRKYIGTGNPKLLTQVPKYLHPVADQLRAAGINIAGSDCCNALKKAPMKKLAKTLGLTGNFTGMRVCESRSRELAWLQHGSLYYASDHKQWHCHPLAFWTIDDVRRYLTDHDIWPDLPPSGSSGCICCMFGAQVRLKSGMATPLQELFRVNRKLWKAAVYDWGYKPALDVTGLPYLPEDLTDEEREWLFDLEEPCTAQ